MIRTAYAAALAALLASSASALEWQSTDAYALAPDASFTNQLLLNAREVRLEGTLRDDAFVLASGAISLSGRAEQDVWLLGSQVALDGEAQDHVRILGQSVIVRGSLARGLAALASAVHLTTNANVRGDVTLAGENVSLEGRIGGNADVLAQSATLGGRVDGDLRVIAQDIVVLPGTHIAGDLRYTSPKEIYLDRTVVLGGKLTRETPAAREAGARGPRALLLAGFQFLAASLAGLAFLALFPRVGQRATRYLRLSLWRSAFAGLAALFVLPAVALVAFITVVGIPLSLVVAGALAILLYLAKVVVALALGSAMLRRGIGPGFGAVAVAALLGLAAIYLISLAPVIGGSVALLVGISGLGALLLAMLRPEGPARRRLGVQPPPPDPETVA